MTVHVMSTADLPPPDRGQTGHGQTQIGAVERRGRLTLRCLCLRLPSILSSISELQSYLCMRASLSVHLFFLVSFKGTNPPLKKSLNIPEIYAKMFGRFH